MLAAILADATNLGLSRMARASEGITRDQLIWTKDAYIRDDTYTTALSTIIDAHHQLPIASVWGDGTTSSSDGQFFRGGKRAKTGGDVNARYGVDPGFGFYTHVSDQHGPYHVKVISAATHEAPYVLDGLLHHGTGLNISEHYTDTGGATDHVFALCAALGFRFCPRLRDFPDRRLIPIEPTGSYPDLAHLLGKRVRADINATDAFLGSLPGVSYANIREPLVNTRNLADLIPLNSAWSGSPVAPCPFYPPGSPPLMQVASGSTPFRLNLHVDDVGHTLIFGPTGSGKSTLLALIAAQFRRYAGAQVFAFDKGRSMLPLTLAIGGDHYEIGGDAAREGEEASPRLAFCPLAELSTDGDRAWAAEWIETLVVLQGVTITPDHRNAISRQVSLMAESRGRSLSDFVSGVQMREIKDALHHYMLIPFANIGAIPSFTGSQWSDLLILGAFHTCLTYILMYSASQKLATPLIAVLSYI